MNAQIDIRADRIARELEARGVARFLIFFRLRDRAEEAVKVFWETQPGLPGSKIAADLSRFVKHFAKMAPTSYLNNIYL